MILSNIGTEITSNKYNSGKCFYVDFSVKTWAFFQLVEKDICKFADTAP